MPLSWFRAAWCALYLLALIAVLALWREAGGESHLELTPWFYRLVFPLVAAGAITGVAVSAANSNAGFWNPRSIAWLGLLMIAALAMAAATYEAHLHENDTTEDDDPKTRAVLRRIGV
jgi:hypothetical protein